MLAIQHRRLPLLTGLRVSDTVWLAIAPLHALLTAARHEAAHALVAIARGGSIEAFVFWPNDDLGRRTFGYVLAEGADSDWISAAAPYLGDLALFAVGVPTVALLRQSTRLRLLWLNAAAFMLVGPLADAVLNWRGGRHSDFARLVDLFTSRPVHAAFAVVVSLLTTGCVLAMRAQIGSKSVLALPVLAIATLIAVVVVAERLNAVRGIELPDDPCAVVTAPQLAQVLGVDVAAPRRTEARQPQQRGAARELCVFDTEEFGDIVTRVDPSPGGFEDRRHLSRGRNLGAAFRTRDGRAFTFGGAGVVVEAEGGGLAAISSQFVLSEEVLMKLGRSLAEQ